MWLLVLGYTNNKINFLPAVDFYDTSKFIPHAS